MAAINDFVAAMTAKDHVALAACFDRFCRFIDYCPSMAGRTDTHLYGANAIEMYFHNKFMFNGFTMREPMVLDDRTVNFFADYNGVIVQAVAEIDNYAAGTAADGSQLIKELVIRPA